MKKEEIILAFSKNQTNIKLADIRTVLQGELGKGDSQIANGRKSIQNVIDGYSKAIDIYSAIIPQADKYIDMAKALGESSIQSSLEKTKKDAQDMIKLSTVAISKLKSI